MSARYPEQDPQEAAWRPPPPPPPPPKPAPGWTEYSDTSRAWPESWYAPMPPRPPVATGRDVSAALVIGLISLLLGAAIGVLWEAVAPKVESIVRDGGYLPHGPENEMVIGVDGRFAALGAAAGALLALVAFVWLRRRSIGVVCALAVGGYLGSYLASLVGGRLGPPAIATHRDDPDGTVFAHPLELGATGVRMVWPIIALLVYLALTLLLDRDDDRPTEPGW